MIKKLIHIILFISVILPVSLKAQGNKNNLVDEYYYKAIVLMNTDKSDEAWNLLKYCQIIDSLNAPVDYALSKLYGKNNDKIKQINLLKKAYEIEPTNQEYAVEYSEALLQKSNFKKAIDILTELIKKYPNNSDYLERLAFYNLNSGNVKETISIYNKLQKLNENIPSEYERYGIEKVRVYRAVGDTDSEIKGLKDLVDKFPNNREYLKFLFSNMLNDKKYYNQAQTIITNLKKDPNTNDIGIFYQCILDINKQDTISSVKNLKRIINIDKASVDNKLQLLRYITAVIGDDSTKINRTIIPLFEQMYTKYPNNTNILLHYSNLLQSIGQLDNAFDKIKQAIAIDPKSSKLYDSATKIFLNDDYLNYLSAICKMAIDNGVKESRYYLWLTLPLINEKKYQEAIDILLSGVNTKSFSSSDKSLLLGVIADLYSSLENKSQALEYYDKALKEYPDNADVCNNYAYMLAEIPNADLEKAERIAANAVRLKQDDPNNLDTYAWIFYKKNNYTLARLYITRALDSAKDETPSAVSLSHAGDIYRALKDYKEALSYYNKAIKVYSIDKTKDNTDAIKIIRRKIKEIKELNSIDEK